MPDTASGVQTDRPRRLAPRPFTFDVPAVEVPQVGSHIPALDAVRGLAVLFVLAHHFLPRNDSSWTGQCLAFLSKSGWIGVDLFFVLSGFLITAILLKSKADRHYFRNFYMRRALRIFPLYYGVLFVSFVVLPLSRIGQPLHLEEFAPQQGWLWSYSTNIFLAVRNQWLLQNSHVAFGHLWSLAVEEHFYLVWPAVVFIVPVRKMIPLCLAGILLSTAGRFAVVGDSAWNLATYLFTPLRLDGLLAGSALATALHLRLNIVRWCLPAAVISAAALTAIAISQEALVYESDRVRTIGFTLLAVMFASLLGLLLGSGKWKRLAALRPLMVLGTYSYGIYVFQGWFGPSLVHAFPPDGAWFGSVRPLLLTSLVVIPAAALSYHLFEKRFLDLKRFF